MHFVHFSKSTFFMENFLNTLFSFASAFFTALFFIALYLLIKFLLSRQAKGKTDWGIIKQMILLGVGFTGVIAFILALPMEEELRGQITSLLGIVISAVFALSSATFIGNMLAGILLRVINSFKPGDFIEIGDYFGRVSERGLFHTELQTIDRDLTTLPNLFLATNPVKVKRMSGTFISSEVSLGYDVSRQKIEQCLLKAAEKTGLTDAFVRITSLGDFSVVYSVHGMLSDLKKIISTKTKLNAMILDTLHEANIEIVSPSFMNQRPTGETIFIPKKERKKPVAEVENKAPEELVFDKAEQAENVEKRKERVEDIDKKIQEVQQLIKDSNSVEEKEKLKIKLEKLKEIKEKSLINIEKKIDEMKGE